MTKPGYGRISRSKLGFWDMNVLSITDDVAIQELERAVKKDLKAVAKSLNKLVIDPPGGIENNLLDAILKEIATSPLSDTSIINFYYGPHLMIVNSRANSYRGVSLSTSMATINVVREDTHRINTIGSYGCGLTYEQDSGEVLEDDMYGVSADKLKLAYSITHGHYPIIEKFYALARMYSKYITDHDLDKAEVLLKLYQKDYPKIAHHPFVV